MKLSDLPVRLVRPLETEETPEERSARQYGYTQKWRDRNRERRNANDRAWRQRKKAQVAA